MKARIAKNNDFVTVGFEVSMNGQQMFSWGVSPNTGMNFEKNVDANKYASAIIELMSIKTELREANGFVSRFFDTAKENGFDTSKGIRFTENKERIEQLERRRDNIINSII